MRILHFLGTIRLPLDPDRDAMGGVTRVTLEIARAQAAMGHDVWVASVASMPGSTQWRGVRLLHLRAATWARWLRRRWPNLPHHLPLVTITTRRAFDVVHVHEHFSTRWIRAKACVVHVHNDPFGPPGVPRFERKARSFWSRVRYADAQVGVSGFITRRLLEGARVADDGDRARRSIHTVYNGVDLERFDPERSAAARSRVREAWGVGPDDVVYLFAGAITPLKGIMVLANAFVSCSEQDRRLHLVLAGGEALWRRPGSRANPDTEAYEAAVHAVLAGARDRGRVHALGVVSPGDLPGIYAASDVLVLPSIGPEAFGLVVAEAMAAGKAVIASAVGGVPEVASEEAALLVPPDDAPALEQSITRLARDSALRRRLGARALERIQHFTWEQSARRLDTIYRSAMTGPRGAGRELPKVDGTLPSSAASERFPLRMAGDADEAHLGPGRLRVGAPESR